MGLSEDVSDETDGEGVGRWRGDGGRLIWRGGIDAVQFGSEENEGKVEGDVLGSREGGDGGDGELKR